MTQQEAPVNSDPVVIPAPPPETSATVKKEEGQKDASKDVLKECTIDDVESMDLKQYIKHVSLWKDQVLSAKYLLAVSLVFYFTSGKGSYGLFTFLIMLLIERTVAVFALTSIGHLLQAKENGLVKKLGEAFSKSGETIGEFTMLPSEKSIKFWLSAIGNYLEKQVIAGVSCLKDAEHDIHMLKVVLAHLFAFLLVFWIFSVQSVIFLTLFIGLSVPPIYTRQKDKIDPVLSKGQEALKPHIETLKAKANELVHKAGDKLDEARQKASIQIKKTKSQVAHKVESIRHSGGDSATETKKTN